MKTLTSIFIIFFYINCFAVGFELNEKEKAWLQDNPIIKLGAITGWPPYNFYNQDGKFSGISAEIIKKIEQNTSLKFKYIKGDWDDLRLRLKDNKINILSAVYYTDKRSNYMLFSRPYSELRDYIFTRNERGDIKDIKSIKRIAIVKGFSQGEVIQSNYKDIKIIWYDSMFLALKGVIAGHADAYIGSIASVSYLLSKHNLIELKVAAPTNWNPVSVSMAIDTSSPELLGIMNKAIETIDEEVINNINRKWAAYVHEKFIDYKLVWKISTISALILLLLFVWLFSLRRQINARILAENKIRIKEEELRNTINSMMDSVITFDENGKISTFNTAAEKIFGYSFSDIKGEDIKKILPDLNIGAPSLESDENNILLEKQEFHGLNKDKFMFPLYISISEIQHDNPNKRRYICTGHDLRNFKVQQEQLRRAMKMDALGKLTGGIAHDYNNLLSIIMGYAEMLKGSLKQQPNLSNHASEILKAVERGAQLTNKLMSFISNTSSKIDQVNINTLITNNQLMLEKTLTARIKLVIDLSENLWPTMLSSNDFQDALLNLCINAKHAMADKEARLTIKSVNVHIDKTESKIINVKLGDYVLLSITDTGSGIDEDIQDKIFDPFFSTKEELGTGLGLSQVYGFIQSTKGYINVDSELGKGSSFKLYFPRFNEHSSSFN